jgi:hypothetical protein
MVFPSDKNSKVEVGSSKPMESNEDSNARLNAEGLEKIEKEE